MGRSNAQMKASIGSNGRKRDAKRLMWANFVLILANVRAILGKFETLMSWIEAQMRNGGLNQPALGKIEPTQGSNGST